MRKEHLLPAPVRYFLSASAIAGAIWATMQHASVQAGEAERATPTPFQPSSQCAYDLETHRGVDVGLENIYYLPGELDSMPQSQEGIAHYYGDGEELNEFTSSGDRFDPGAMAAASWFYPLGMSVRVTDLTDGDSIVVTINDRGPNRVDRPDVIIDLTAGVMHKLQPGAGNLPVLVEPVCSP